MSFFNFKGSSSRELGLTEATKIFLNCSLKFKETEDDTPTEQEISAAKKRWDKRLKHKACLKNRKKKR